MTARSTIDDAISKALPCENIDKLMRPCEPDTGRPICNACKRRPAVRAAFIELLGPLRKARMEVASHISSAGLGAVMIAVDELIEEANR